jgi:hypothetical protein
MDAAGRASVTVADYPALTPEMIEAIYAADASVEVAGAGYTMRISGGDIVNTGNELATGITFSENADGVEFLLNRGRNLPGRVRLGITDGELPEKYVYLYSNTKKKYELLDVREGDALILDVGGKYLLTDEKIAGFRVNPFIVFVSAAALAAAIIVFIIVRRRYWFW